jgi:hypothetical protein
MPIKYLNMQRKFLSYLSPPKFPDIGTCTTDMRESERVAREEGIENDVPVHWLE